MVIRKKRRNTPGNNGKQLKPRQGEKARQVKEAQEIEMETKGVRQTKLAFAATGIPEKTQEPMSTSNNEEVLPTQKKKLSFAAAIGTPQKANDGSDNARSTAITPELKTGPTNNAQSKSPAKQDLQQQENTEINTKQDKATTKSDDSNNKKLTTKPPAIKLKRPTQSNKNTETTTTTKETGTYNTLEKYHAIRYNGLIETPPSNKPFEDIVTLLKEYFKIIQEVLGKDILYILRHGTVNRKNCFLR
jgi:hypothetical protein